MAITPPQTKLIHVAAKVVGLNRAQYRTLLSNVADVESSRDLDQAKFEDVMAVLEDMGFGGRTPGGTYASRFEIKSVYWRNKVADRGDHANARMVRKIEQMALESRYELGALVSRFSEHRTTLARQLHPGEAWNLIEMLKASIARDGTKSSAAMAQPGKEPPQGSGCGHEARSLFG